MSRLDSLSVEHPSPVPAPTSSTVSLLPYHARPIRRSFNFSFQLQFFPMSSQLSSDNISPSVSVSRPVSLVLPFHPLLPSSSPSREINTPRHVVSTCRSSSGPCQRASEETCGTAARTEGKAEIWSEQDLRKTINIQFVIIQTARARAWLQHSGKMCGFF